MRRGALTLAVSGIIGGNAFDTLFVAASDIAYRDGSIYHVVSNQVLLWIAITIVMTGVMMLGLIRREEQNWGGIGFESASSGNGSNSTRSAASNAATAVITRWPTRARRRRSAQRRCARPCNGGSTSI